LRQKYNLAEYEGLWRNDPERHGCVPMQQAVDSLQMDAQSISLLIDKGILESFDVGDDSNIRSLVTLKSLLQFKAAKAAPTQDRPPRILAMLTEAARNKKTLAFGDVVEAVGLNYPEAMHRRMFKQDLREATRQSELYARGLLISALLVFRTQYIAEDDFFLMAKELGMFTPCRDSKTVFFRDHLERIFHFYQNIENVRTTSDK